MIKLHIKPKTKAQWKEVILSLLGVSTAAEAAKWAKKNGFPNIDLCYKEHWISLFEKASEVWETQVAASQKMSGGYYFPDKRNRESCTVRQVYYGPFETKEEVQWYSAFHHGTSESQAPWSNYPKEWIEDDCVLYDWSIQSHWFRPYAEANYPIAFDRIAEFVNSKLAA